MFLFLLHLKVLAVCVYSRTCVLKLKGINSVLLGDRSILCFKKLTLLCLHMQHQIYVYVRFPCRLSIKWYSSCKFYSGIQMFVCRNKYLGFLSRPISCEQTMETIRSRRIISYHRGLWKQQEKSMYPKVIFFLRDTHFSTIFQASVTGYATPLYRFFISIIVYRK